MILLLLKLEPPFKFNFFFGALRAGLLPNMILLVLNPKSPFKVQPTFLLDLTVIKARASFYSSNFLEHPSGGPTFYRTVIKPNLTSFRFSGIKYYPPLRMSSYTSAWYRLFVTEEI